MANKRYDQFPAGTYDTAKIFLQADATTGALEKILLPVITAAVWGSITGTLEDQTDLNDALALLQSEIGTVGTGNNLFNYYNFK